MRALFGIALIVGGVTSCGGLFDVENPANILDKDLDDPFLIAAMANTPQGALSLGYSGALVYGELAGDAVFHASTNIDPFNIDWGVFDAGWNVYLDPISNNLFAGRWIADDALRRLEAMIPNAATDRRVGEGYFWTGIFRLTLGDLYEEVVYDNGAPITPRQAIRDGIARLETAVQISGAAGNVSYQAAALGAIARAYRSLYFEELHEGSGADPSLFQQAADYAERALAKKADFRVDLGYAPPGSSNAAFSGLSQGNIFNRIDPRYANRMDPVSGNRDPRIKHTARVAIAPDGREIYEQTKYNSHGSSIPISRWQEAELIIAEHRMMQADYPNAVIHINNVRNAAGLPDFASTDPDEIRNQFMYERETELWLELRRWQDHRYYEIIPDDWIPASRERGVHRRFQVPDRERNTNPNYR